MARPVKKHKFNEDIEEFITHRIFTDEYQRSKSAKKPETLDFESCVDMLECKRNEKDYEWMSDIFIPEFPAVVLTDASGWANQYFQSRDFVEVKLDGSTKDGDRKAMAAKKCINSTLNNREIYHYHKYIRARLINTLGGQVYALCWWNTKKAPEIVGHEEPIISETGEEIINPVYGQKILKDHFDYEPIDARNVFTDSKYCYSIQDKDFIIIRTEKTYEELKSEEESKGYFNIHILKDFIKSQGQTETARETYEQREQTTKGQKDIIKSFDVLMRFGKYWCIVKERDEEGYPSKVVPGIDDEGYPLSSAELLECIIEIAYAGNSQILIRFQPNPYRDIRGNPYRPIIRGWCYIHPTKDTGLSDGKYNREIQIAVNDAFNLGTDRAKLSTLPTLIGTKLSLEHNDTIYFEPQHVMEVEDINHLKEFKIDPDISGVLSIIDVLLKSSQRVSAVYPTSMGELPKQASTTATAVAGAEQRTNLRANYKSLTFEFTYLIDFYTMILNMTYQFAEEETAFKMMGDDAQFFDPDQLYSYSPVSSNIEMEYNKYRKLQVIDQFMGRLAKIPNPNIFKLLNYLLKKAFSLFGDEFPDYRDFLLDEKAPVQPEGPGKEIPAIGGPETSNQAGQPVSSQEMYGREIGQS